MCTYNGEYYPGYCNNGVAASNSIFKVYTIRRGDSHLSNPDWQNWGLMVPYGAPFVDVNMSGNYEPMIDTPGVKNASQTVFMCLTDGFSESHNPGEGSGGGLFRFMQSFISLPGLTLSRHIRICSLLNLM